MTNGKENRTEKLSYSYFNSQQLASREMDSTVSTRLVRLLVDQPSRSSPLFIPCQRPLSVQGRTGFDTPRREITLKRKPNQYRELRVTDKFLNKHEIDFKEIFPTKLINVLHFSYELI